MPMRAAVHAVQTMTSVGAFDAIALENELVRAVIVPELGGCVWELTDRVRGRQWIWHRGDVPSARATPGSDYDQRWAGGWEELFPNDAAGLFEGRNLPDHGEWWTARWRVAPPRSRGSSGPRLEVDTRVRATRCAKEFSLDAETLTVSYRIESLEEESFHCLFKQHFAVAITPTCRLWLPGGTVTVVDPSFGTLVGASPPFAWPRTTRQDGLAVDLEVIPVPSPTAREFLYVENPPVGECGVDDLEARASLRMRYDRAALPFVWLFLAYGGWRNCYTAVLEPCTNMPKDLERAVRSGRSLQLHPGGIFETKVHVTLSGLEKPATTTESR